MCWVRGLRTAELIGYFESSSKTCTLRLLKDEERVGFPLEKEGELQAGPFLSTDALKVWDADLCRNPPHFK